MKKQQSKKGDVSVFFWHSIIRFGNKHKGSTVREVFETDPGYLIWCDTNIEWFELADGVYEEVWERFNEPDGNHYDFK